MLNISLQNSTGAHDITGLVSTVRWSGDYRQCARVLEVGMLSSPVDSRVPVVACEVGSRLHMTVDGVPCFEGIVTDRTKSTASNIIDLTAYDVGFYLNRNETSVRFDDQTPEAAVAQLCAEFGIPVGQLAATGVAVRRKFSMKSLYDIVMSLYSAAAEVTGKVYHLVFEAGKLNIREKGATGQIVVIESGVNLMDATISESIQKLVNQVAVYDSDDNLLYTKTDDKSVETYGLMQKALSQDGDKDATAAVQTALAESEPSQVITVNNLGDTRCVTGGCVMVKESHTGLCGQFFIDSDVHQWKNGVYTSKLVLNLNAVMDEKSAGELLK